MKEKVSAEFERLTQTLGRTPQRIWISVGSGTLAGIFREVAPKQTQLLCLDVQVLAHDDPRLLNLTADPRVHMRRTPEKFHQPAMSPPPFASNTHYDAKVWRYILSEAEDGDVWWNVAR